MCMRDFLCGTRAGSYPGRLTALKMVAILMVPAVLAGPAGAGPAPPASATVRRLIEPFDKSGQPSPMKAAEVAALLNDPWASLVLRQGVAPKTMDAALKALNKHNGTPSEVSQQSIFLISENGQIPFDKASGGLTRQFRFVVTRMGKDQSEPPILLSATYAADGSQVLLEVVSWNNEATGFNFYRFDGPAGWTWRGNSAHALQEPTRGKGCFQCHVNGHLVMKELKVPWQNWHSQSADIAEEALPKNSPLLANPLFRNKIGAEDLEPVVRAWIHKLSKARVRALKKGDGTLHDPRPLLRPLYETTTVNLVSSLDRSQGAGAKLRLPLSFFYNVGALHQQSVGIERPKAFGGTEQPTVARKHYEACLHKYQFALVEGPFRQPGDTFFAFLVPEPAAEDVNAVQQLIAEGIVTAHFARCVLLVDFQNPIFSAQRAGLWKYVPDHGKFHNGQSDLPKRIADAIADAASRQPAGAGTAEQQFLEAWRLPEEKATQLFAERLEGYLAAVKKQLATLSGVEAYVRLADARRNEFKAARPMGALVEFALLFPRPSVSIPLRMKLDGTVGPP